MNANSLQVMVIQAIDFAAGQHKFQRRKGFYRIPYINHPIRVMRILAEAGGVVSPNILAAAALHDVLEDTDCKEDQIEKMFGPEVLTIVKEVTDDMNLPSAERKRKQILKAPTLSEGGRMIKMADKIANMQDILTFPLDWSRHKKLAYFQWATEVAKGCSGVNSGLEKAFEEIFQLGMQKYS